ncbi:SnoaL-like polyketide cyclase [Lutimaribacter pacificus]|uniref:SnoaL-like polyketide cyclase n=1 Tax=Lutimaribacter pacificus TaxID=391948 RepID=A0A1H0A2I8_9RHOB|nr:ester cyclase [Lutimaribacter pacificus]SDN28022.1 SnoaL-like polyketide cyclase [Lutimaribacter pacificus]SHJ73714.1 SnoaL-like polyketide cyclase [Lutimaribacter pacificus]
MSLVERTETLVRGIWEHADDGAVRRMFTADAEIRGLEDMDLMGPDEFAAFHRMILRQFTDIRISDVTGIEQDDRVALTFRVEAMDALRHRPVAVSAYLMVRYRGDRICEGRNLLDLISLFEQAGRLPQRTRDMCLLGHELGLTSVSGRRAH